jgi:hypothetical protein
MAARRRCATDPPKSDGNAGVAAVADATARKGLAADTVRELASRWKLEASTVDEAAAEARALFDSSDNGIVFLLAKGVLRDKLRPQRMRESFELVLNPPDAEWQARRKRLDRLVQVEGDRAWDSAPEGWQTLDQWRAAVPGWEDKDIFHLRHGVLLPQRCQLSGLCYIHAPEVLQHYLVSLTDKTHKGMIDMVKLIRENFGADHLERHVFDDAGGSSLATLKAILEPGSECFSTRSSDFARCLERYGPGLVTSFGVHQDFHGAQAPSYDGKPAGDFVGHHAMVLIGARQDGGGKRFFLLQNWWRQSQFVEVSEAYLKACGATVYFVETKQTRIPDEFPVQLRLVAENESVDKPERLMCEDPVAPPQPLP